jgi:hypothetical protein
MQYWRRDPQVQFSRIVQGNHNDIDSIMLFNDSRELRQRLPLSFFALILNDFQKSPYYRNYTAARNVSKFDTVLVERVNVIEYSIFFETLQ